MAQRRHWLSISQACKTHDVSLMEEAVSIASQPDSRYTVQEVLQRGLKRSAARGAVNVLCYVLDQGADIHLLTADTITATDDDPVKPSQEVLEILVSRGWDINSRGVRNTGLPLLWYLIHDPDLLTWCLAHGARMEIQDQPPKTYADGTGSREGPPLLSILEMVAASGRVETFELLRARGAPLGPRTLHRAVEYATYHCPWGDSNASPAYGLRMAMVRHLVDDLKLNVNAVQYELYITCTSPLCYVARRPTPGV